MLDMLMRITFVFWRAEYVREGWTHEQIGDDDGEQDDHHAELDEDGDYANTADRLKRLFERDDGLFSKERRCSFLFLFLIRQTAPSINRNTDDMICCQEIQLK